MATSKSNTNKGGQQDLATAAANMAKQPAKEGALESELRTALGGETNQPVKGDPKAAAAGAVSQQQQAAAPANANAIPTRKGRMRRPRRTVIYGAPGVGKTTLGADATSEPGADDVVLIDLDNGSESLDVARYVFRPQDERHGHVPRTLEEFIGGIRKLAAGGHGYRRVVIDQLERIEQLAIRYIVKRDDPQDGSKGVGIQSYGYNKGKDILLDEMRSVLHEISGLVNAGIDVLILAHSAIAKHTNPGGENWDRHVIKCQELVAGYIFGWADEVGFLHFDDRAERQGGKGKSRGKVVGTTTGRRHLEFDHAATWDAKARLPFPRSIPIGSASPWEFYRQALDRAYKMTPAEIRAEITAELERIGDLELASKVDIEVKKVGDNLDKLTAYMQDLRRREALEKSDDADTTTDADI